MPYQKKVKGRGSIWLEKYMSPLKMFDYMAASMVIIASNLRVYKHILKNNFNCRLVNVNKDNEWSNAIQSSFENTTMNKYLKKNAYKTVQKYTWDKRCKSIVHFLKKNNRRL